MLLCMALQAGRLVLGHNALVNTGRANMTAKVIDFRTGKEIKAKEAHCSFCKKPESQVKNLVSNGSDKHICDECIKKFKGFISG